MSGSTRYCCDPRKRHKKKKAAGLREITTQQAVRWNLTTGLKLCRNCQQALANQDSSSSQSEFEPPEVLIKSLDDSAATLDISPLKPVKPKDAVTYAKRKSQEFAEAAKKKLAKGTGVPDEALKCEKCNDLDLLVALVRQKIKVSTKNEKVKLLTLAPESWSIKKTLQEFSECQITSAMVRKARKLKGDKGILAESDKKKGRNLSQETINRVVAYYQTNDNTRMCPGKKDCVKTKDGSKQKQLILVNLKELHCSFKVDTGMQIGFSKFCELRPKWCVTVNSKGMHNVCVCTQHQNAKLMLAAVPDKLDYYDYLSKLVCSTSNRHCMMTVCDSCPGKEELKEYLEHVFSEDFDLHQDDLRFKQWVHTDRTTLVDQVLNVDDFIDTVCEKLSSLRAHHYTSKAQSAYLKKSKDELEEGTAIVLLDFAENYNFIVQDAVQGFHWNTTQATLHPFVIYHKKDEKLCHKNIVIISDHLDHSTSTVHAFIHKIVPTLKSLGIKKVVYFSDGAASQYKNRKNFVNLCHHHIDHGGITAEWHFFATSHGKSPCDGLGGTTKRLVSRASLQATVNHQMLTPEAMFQWADRYISEIHFIWVPSSVIENHCRQFKLEERYSTAKTISGTRSHHSFVPTGLSTITMKRLSEDYDSTTMQFAAETRSSNENSQYQPGKYVACFYDRDWFICIITERCNEEQDAKVRFMIMNKNTKSLRWPTDDEECWIPFQDIICIVNPPEISGRTGRQYRLGQTDMDEIQKNLILKQK